MSELAPSTVSDQELSAGFRFRASQEPRLRLMVDALRTNPAANEHVALFEKAADCARDDEPVIVHGTTVQEIQALAEAFTFWGLDRPSIDWYTRT